MWFFSVKKICTIEFRQSGVAKYLEMKIRVFKYFSIIDRNGFISQDNQLN